MTIMRVVQEFADLHTKLTDSQVKIGPAIKLIDRLKQYAENRLMFKDDAGKPTLDMIRQFTEMDRFIDTEINLLLTQL